MANFAVAASNATIEKASEIMDLYAHAGDKKEDTFLRILAIAEAEATKGKHPELLENLNAVENTIGTLIRQINGIVSGQDNIVLELQEKLNKAIEEKEEALKKSIEKVTEAEKTLEQANTIFETAENKRLKAEKDLQMYKTLADEKTERNTFLEKRVTALERDLEDYKSLQNSNKDLETQFIKLQAQMDLEKEKASIAKERELEKIFNEERKEYNLEIAKLTLKIEQLESQTS